MNKALKIAFLVITLAVPLGIFIFLRLFGENKFDIPVYYNGGVADEVTNCGHGERPFVVPDSLVTEKGPSLVFFFLEGNDFNAITLNNHVQRLQELFKDALPELIVYSSRESLQNNDIQVRILPQESVEKIMQCGFILNEFNRYVLVDRKNRIRGYYSTERDEVDRLIVEIKILLEHGTGR